MVEATAPGSAYEGRLLEVFRKRNVRRVVLPLAVHAAQPWLLSDDAGPTLRQTRPAGDGDHDLGAWERILREYAHVQRSVEGDDAVAEMLGAGLGVGEMDGFDDSVASWLMELAGRLDGPTWTDALSTR